MRHSLTASLCCAFALGFGCSLAASACGPSNDEGDAGPPPGSEGGGGDDVGGDTTPGDDAGPDAPSEDATNDSSEDVTNDASEDVTIDVEAGEDDASDDEIGDCRGDGGSGTFTCTGALVVARNAPGGAVLQDGKVLVAGGWNNQTLTSSAEVYDPASGKFTKTGSMDSQHYLAGWDSPWAVLPSGKVLVAGGLKASGTLLSSAELYDPAASSFAATGPLGTAVVSYDPATLADGTVLFVGGYSSVPGVPLTAGSGFSFTAGTNKAQLYDPTSGVFAAAGTLAEARLFGCNVVLASGDVLAIGGFQGVSTAFESNIEQYDPSLTAWSTVGTLTGGVTCSVSAFVLPSGNVFLDGSFLLDPVALTTTPTTNALPSAAKGGTFMQLANGDVLALPQSASANAQVYHAATDLWSSVDSPGFGGCRAFLLPSGEALVVGGTDAAGKSQAMGLIYHP